MANIVAPIPGKVLSIGVKKGQVINADDLVLILEALKMENEIFSNFHGEVVDIKVNEGDSVNANDVLIVLG